MQLGQAIRTTATRRLDVHFGHGGLLLLVALVFLAGDVADAGVYRYKDANGVWHFTDTPDHPVDDGAVHGGGEAAAATAGSSFGKDLGKQLAHRMPPQNKIEQARNATVSITRAAGSGSGFFTQARIAVS